MDEDNLRRLDSLEGEGSLYIRQEVEVSMESGTIMAFVYIWNYEITNERKISYEDQPWKASYHA